LVTVITDAMFFQMPKANRNKGVYAKWDKKTLKIAVCSVVIDGVSKKTAAKMFNIPRSTMIRHVVTSGEGVKKNSVESRTREGTCIVSWYCCL